MRFFICRRYQLFWTKMKNTPYLINRRSIMARSEFRWNKKRRHFVYIFKDIGDLRLNIIITTKPVRIVHSKTKANVRLYKHPNPNSKKTAYIIPYIYIDHLTCFFEKRYRWKFDINDKRKIKRIKKTLFKTKSQL